MPDPTTVVQIVTGIVQELMDGRIRIKSDHVSTNHHDCNRETCAWKSKEVRILTLQQRVIGFGGVRSQFVLVTKFEYNGCDVNNARIALGGSGRFGNFIGFLSGMEYDASATAGASQIRSTPSGCERCCKEAAIPAEPAAQCSRGQLHWPFVNLDAKISPDVHVLIFS